MSLLQPSHLHVHTMKTQFQQWMLCAISSVYFQILLNYVLSAGTVNITQYLQFFSTPILLHWLCFINQCWHNSLALPFSVLSIIKCRDHSENMSAWAHLYKAINYAQVNGDKTTLLLHGQTLYLSRQLNSVCLQHCQETLEWLKISIWSVYL